VRYVFDLLKVVCACIANMMYDEFCGFLTSKLRANFVEGCNEKYFIL
jgi:hypothetical protein